MQHEGCFAIFVKTPGLSPVKTRLAAQLGRERAEQFHLLAASAVASVCRQLESEGFCTLYAVAEPAKDESLAVWQDLPLIHQPEGGLGERMAAVYADLRCRYARVFLVGADVPQLEAGYLQAMAAWLQQAPESRFAVAPSEDGGFWCVGGNAVIEWSTWTGVTYSRSSTRQEFMAGLQRHGDIRLFASLRDVDEFSDLLALADALKHMPRLTPEQRLLAQTLDDWLAERSDRDESLQII